MFDIYITPDEYVERLACERNAPNLDRVQPQSVVGREHHHHHLVEQRARLERHQEQRDRLAGTIPPE